MSRHYRRSGLLFTAALLLVAAPGCGDDGGGGSGPPDNTSLVGTFSGLFDDVAVGFNYPYDVGIVPNTLVENGANVIAEGDILVANYGTSELLLVKDPTGAGSGQSAEPFYDGATDGLRGAMGVSVLPDGTIWAAFERGGDGDGGALVVLSPAGDTLAVIDGASAQGAFANPSGICYGGGAPAAPLVFFVNKGDGTAWRVSAINTAGDQALLEQVGSGLATGAPGNPGTPPDGVSNKSDLPEGGARGCAYLNGFLYVADAQNARVVRFDGVDTGGDRAGKALEDTPAELVTYPTGVTINSEGYLIVISFDNAHAFVSLETPSGGFIDDGLQELNVNSGNYGVQVGDGTIWFTRANNTNGALRAITRDMDTPPSTAGTFPPQ